ncbi:MAG: mechanosensitive ion channel family protein [Candidatus Omnitrophica bacterium]|nr:mechanosensitive ion channel family protein [Candidatus Omnitrophota bacterium]MDD5352051.1 mechanosensitive ion channel family protein [Candidatus Omnitrophota bacterium]MDD5549649.1 mechanosensitive ion channel family protein [Candidatus Omnitrophota bacterium]
MNIFSVSSFQYLFEILIPASILLITLIFGFIIRKIIFARLNRWSRHTKTQVDDIIIDSIKGPFIIWFLMLGIYFALEYSKLPENLVHIIDKFLLVLGIFSITFVLANISAKLISVYSRKVETALPVTSLTQNISRIIIFTIGILVVLHSLGVSITPILATLGVGGLAVALALQDTLSNLFSGFYIIVSKQIKIGDYIKLDSGEEGYVTDITWRTTKIKMLPNNVVLVPNEKLTKAIVTNYYLPDKEMAVLVNLGVHYKSDLKKVEKITCEVAREVMKEVLGGVPEFEPFIRYGSFADSSVNLTVILRAKEFVDQYLIKHEFIKRLHERYAKEGIVIPYPIRAINYGQEKE